jgi:lysophospholipase L1-like esterase
MSNLFTNSRRGFIKSASVATVASLAIPQIVSAAFAVSKPKRITLNKGDVVLFQGDSITDWGRNKITNGANVSAGFGTGYPLFAAGELMKDNPDKGLQLFNRGISGDKVFQLADRWDKDCLELKPNVLSILIGVNDFWAISKHGYTGTIETYRNDYAKLLERTKKALPDVKLIIGEPFAVNGVKDVNDSWFPKFNEYRQVAKETAEAFGAVFIPYQKVFDEALTKAPGSYWTIDGVHPTMAGASLMAHAWLQTVKS